MIIAPRTDPNILDSNVAVIESGIPVWNSSDTYNLKDKVQVNGTTNRVYEASQDVPAGVDPTTDVNKTTGIGTYWFDRGATNYMKAFDALESSQCENTDSIYYKFDISDQDIIMFENIDTVMNIRLVLTDTNIGTVVLDKTEDTTTRDVYDWFDWTYVPIEYKKSYFARLPLHYDATLEVYLTHTGSTVKVGHIAYGRSKNYGLSLIKPNPVVSMRGITSKRRDAFGNIVTRRKARYKRMNINCVIDSVSVDLIQERLNSLADTPAIFVGDERDGGYRALLIYGEVKDHDMPISISKTQYQLQVEGYI